MKNIGTCPRCGGRSLAEWLDGDISCWVCGYVIYQRALIPVDPDVRGGGERLPRHSRHLRPKTERPRPA